MGSREKRTRLQTSNTVLVGHTTVAPSLRKEMKGASWARGTRYQLTDEIGVVEVGQAVNRLGCGTGLIAKRRLTLCHFLRRHCPSLPIAAVYEQGAAHGVPSQSCAHCEILSPPLRHAKSISQPSCAETLLVCICIHYTLHPSSAAPSPRPSP